MPRSRCLVAAALAATVGFALAAAPSPARAEILAMMNYETKSPDSLRTLKLSGDRAREEGIAILDVDPASERYGHILMTIPLPPDLVAHHIFYDRSMTKAYVTALGKSELQVIDMTVFPYRTKTLALPDCAMGEDVIFSEDNSTWYLTCMMSARVIVGDRESDEVIGTIELPGTYPHGIALNSGIDRLLVTSTIKGDLTEPDEVMSVVEASSLKPLGSIKLSNKPSPSGEAPVEILFVPGSQPATAYITNMFGGAIWAATWNPAKNDFDVTEAFSFAEEGDGVVLELYFNEAGDRLYVTTAKPGRLHVFDISGDLAKPQLVKSLPAGEGAHHVAFTKDGKFAFVQNALLNLPGMSEGTVTVVDLQKHEAIGQIDSLQKLGYNPNSIVLLPDWNALAGH